MAPSGRGSVALTDTGAMFSALAARFERLVDPYPPAAPQQPPARFFAFLWRCSEGLRPHLAAVTLLTAGIAAAEAILFSLVAQLVDWLGAAQPAQLRQQMPPVTTWLLWVLLASVLLAAGQALTKYQGVFANFPMRLRWNFHRLMLGRAWPSTPTNSPAASPPRSCRPRWRCATPG
jgi:ATP-binding cassette subfamily B multidrug efflux pump